MNQNENIQIALIGNRVTPVVSGALSSNFNTKKIILVAGGKFLETANNISSVLQPAGLHVEIISLSNPYSIEETRNVLLDILVNHENEKPILNTSSGTRPMCIAAFEVFNEFQQEVFYINPVTNMLYYLHQPERKPIALDHQLKIPAFLQVHGSKVSHSFDRTGIKKTVRQFASELASKSLELAKPLSTLNWLAKSAENTLTSAELSDKQLSWYELTYLLDEMEHLDLLYMQNNCIVFNNEDARFFANGGWLEEHVYATLFGLRAELDSIQDIGRGIEISRPGRKGELIYNELDVVCLNNNQLHLIECKTKKFHKKSNPGAYDTPGSETLYKLDSLKSTLGHVSTRMMLVSFNSISKWNKQRATDLGIEVVDGFQLTQLEKRLKTWLRQ